MGQPEPIKVILDRFAHRQPTRVEFLRADDTYLFVSISFDRPRLVFRVQRSMWKQLLENPMKALLNGAQHAGTVQLLAVNTSTPAPSWSDRIGFFAPRSFREGWFGDVIEDYSRMKSAGCGGVFRVAALVSQCIWMIVARVMGSLKDLVTDALAKVLRLG